MSKGKGIHSQEELLRIQEESQKQALPEQKRVFSVPEKLRRRVHNLSAPTRPTLGYDGHKAFDRVFPYIHLLRFHLPNHGDTVIFVWHDPCVLNIQWLSTTLQSAAIHYKVIQVLTPNFCSYANHWLYHYRGVPKKHFEQYLKEIEWRFNHRTENLVWCITFYYAVLDKLLGKIFRAV